MTNTIIFSDLDGTLLDPVTYSHREACPALSRVHELHIPLILCSSKTRAEIEVCRQRLDNTHPFISENGGGIFIPKGYFKMPIEASELNGYLLITLGTPYAEILRNFSSLRRRFPVQVRGFADMSTEEVSKLTGLSLAEAVLAKHRDFDEPFVFEGAPSERFLQAIESSNLRWTQGRLFHIMGNHDKGRAVSKRFKRCTSDDVVLPILGGCHANPSTRIARLTVFRSPARLCQDELERELDPRRV